MIAIYVHAICYFPYLVVFGQLFSDVSRFAKEEQSSPQKPN